MTTNHKKDINTTVTSIPRIGKKNKFEDLINQIKTKINQTPCWSEFSKKSKEQMIGKYFDSKIKNTKYSKYSYNSVDKFTFIAEVLKSVV